MTDERWLPIPGWEGLYEASDHGQIRTVARVVPAGFVGTRKVPPRVRKLRQDKDGYLLVSLHRPGLSYTAKVHRLVLETFVGPCLDGMESCHDDGNRQNNRVSNLRWDTHQANIADVERHRTHANARKIQCSNGHAFTTTNTRLRIRNGRKTRVCRACERDRKGNRAAVAA